MVLLAGIVSYLSLLTPYIRVKTISPVCKKKKKLNNNNYDVFVIIYNTFNGICFHTLGIARIICVYIFSIAGNLMRTVGIHVIFF